MPEDPLNLSGKIALVTGASRGIGAAIASILWAHGARVVLNFVNDPDGKNKSDAQSLSARLPNSLLIQADVSDDLQVQTAMDQIKSSLGHLDILINNAGILLDRSLKKITPAEWSSVLNVNLTGPFNCTRHAIPLLRDAGRIVNISSLSASAGFFGQANYASAKAGLIALTKVTARELASRRITANAIAPGVVDTDMLKPVPDPARQALVAQIPLARMATPDDIAGAVLFLCSPLASYITGQTLHINGGFFMP